MSDRRAKKDLLAQFPEAEDAEDSDSDDHEETEIDPCDSVTFYELIHSFSEDYVKNHLSKTRQILLRRQVSIVLQDFQSLKEILKVVIKEFSKTPEDFEEKDTGTLQNIRELMKYFCKLQKFTVLADRNKIMIVKGCKLVLKKMAGFLKVLNNLLEFLS